MNPLRPSLRQPTRLGDWIAPMHFARETVRLSGVSAEIRASAKMPREAWAEAMARGRRAKLSEGYAALAAADGLFYGRRAQLYALEKACETTQPALIHGEPGIGKTELAKAFGRWMAASGGVDQPGYVCFHGFEPDATEFDLDALLAEIFERVGGGDLHTGADTAERRAEIVLEALTQHRCLLILDGFDSVATLGERSRAALMAFLERLPQTGSALVLTSRSTEEWLGGPEALARVPLGGLHGQDAFAYADALLADLAEARANRAADPPAFAEILARLDGVPQTLKQVLPQLGTLSAAQILKTINGESQAPAEANAAEPETDAPPVTVDEASPAPEPAEQAPEAEPQPEAALATESEADAEAETPVAEPDTQPEPTFETEPEPTSEVEPETTAPDHEPAPEAAQTEEPAPPAEPALDIEPDAVAEPVAVEEPELAAEPPSEPALEPESAASHAAWPVDAPAESPAAEPTPIQETAPEFAPAVEPDPPAEPANETVPGAEPEVAPRPETTAEIAAQRARMLALLSRHKKEDEG